MSKYRRQTVAILGMMVGLITAAMGALMTSQDGGRVYDRLFFLIIPAFLSIVATFLVHFIKDFLTQAMKIRFTGINHGLRNVKDSKAEKDEATDEDNQPR